MINSNLYYPIESKVISSKNRFALKATDILELKKDLSGSSIFRVKLPNLQNAHIITKKILKFENYIKLQKYLRLTFKNLNHLKKLPKLVKLYKCIYNVNKKFILND